MRFASALLVLLILFAGTAAAGDLTYGAKVGMILANVTGDPIVIEEGINWKIEHRIGMLGGVFLNYEINQNVSLQPELLFAMKGFKSSFSEEGVSVDIDGKLNYIEVPLLAKLNVTMESAVVPCFYLGPSIGFNMSSKAEGDISGYMQSFDISSDWGDITNTFDFGLVFGIGLEGKMGPGLIKLDVRYNLGLTKILKDGEITWDLGGQEEQPEQVEGIDSKNKGLVFMLGYAF